MGWGGEGMRREEAKLLDEAGARRGGAGRGGCSRWGALPGARAGVAPRGSRCGEGGGDAAGT